MIMLNEFQLEKFKIGDWIHSLKIKEVKTWTLPQKSFNCADLSLHLNIKTIIILLLKCLIIQCGDAAGPG